jgi:hypothetical protein
MRIWGSIIVAACLAGCGGSGGVEVGEDCSFDACGGDPTGDWTFGTGSYCIDPYQDEDCPEATLETNLATSGSLVLASDGTFTMQLTATGELVFHLPLRCIDGATCSDGDTPELDLYCEEDGADDCRCVSIIDSQRTADGNWQTEGDVIGLIDDSDQEVEVAGEYCTRGDELVIRSQESTEPYTWILTR